MDQELKEMAEREALKWLPFIGEKYLHIPEENRMLIIGESHYYKDTEESKSTVNHIDFTKEMIQENAIEGVDWKTKIIPNFHKVMFREDEFSKEDFWNVISYYNFIQRPMLTRGERPNENDFFEGWKTFFDLIKVTKPKICLFIGVSASNYLISAIQDSGFTCNELINTEPINGTNGRSTILKDSENNETKIIFIKHTSMFFSWLNWNSYLKDQMKSQFDWIENKLEIKKKPEEYYNIFNDESKQKLSDIHIAIDKRIITKELASVNGEIEFNAPSNHGEGSDLFRYKISINDITLFYEIAIDDYNFESYYYGLKNKQIDKLEKAKSWYTYYDNNIVENIAKKITEEIIQIIHVLKE